MNTKLIFLVAGLLWVTAAKAQSWEFEKPDYEKIKANIQEEDSDLFYENLMGRFQKSDSTFTLEQKRHLYYGYIFQPKYSPYGISPLSDSLNSVLEKDDYTDSDLEKIIKLTDLILLDNPFNIRMLNTQLSVFVKREEKEKFAAKMVQMKTVIDAVMSSGDGTSKEFAFYVIYTGHEYMLLNVFGFEVLSQSLIEHYDYLSVAENEAGLEGLYFDVSPCLNSMSGMFGE